MADLAMDLAGGSAGGFPGGFWPGSIAGSVAATLGPAAVYNFDFDVAALPNNAAAVIQWSWVAFGIGAAGLNVATAGVVIAYRNNAGLLRTDPNAWASIASGIPADPLVGVGAIALVGNTVRMPITNGGGNTRFVGRYAIAFVPAGVALA